MQEITNYKEIKNFHQNPFIFPNATVRRNQIRGLTRNVEVE